MHISELPAGREPGCRFHKTGDRLCITRPATSYPRVKSSCPEREFCSHSPPRLLALGAPDGEPSVRKSAHPDQSRVLAGSGEEDGSWAPPDTSGEWADPSSSNCSRSSTPLTLTATLRGLGSPGRPITSSSWTFPKAPWPRAL